MQYKKATQDQREGALKCHYKRPPLFWGALADTWEKFGTSSVRRTFTMAHKWFTRRVSRVSCLGWNIYVSTFCGHWNSHLYTRHVAPSKTCTLTVCHQIQHSLRQRLGYVKVWLSQQKALCGGSADVGASNCLGHMLGTTCAYMSARNVTSWTLIYSNFKVKHTPNTMLTVRPIFKARFFSWMY